MATDTNTSTRTRVALTISKDSMAASVLLRKPQDGEGEVSVEEILDVLSKGDVVFGIDQAAIEKAVGNGEFNTPVRVALGRKPEKGINTSFIYHFDTSADHKPKEDENGHIDYKDISFIQNVDKGTKLASKVPPTPGKPGQTVLGKELKGPDGRDMPFKNGINTEVSDDGLTLIATASGAINFQFNKVSVNDVTVIKGDIDHTVGNITCKGSVRVTGSIKAGYEVNADGDLEVNGNVEDSILNVTGDIFIKGGFFGKSAGVMTAGGDITVKFAEGQKLMAGRSVYIGGEIINCQVEAKEKVEVKGRSGKIVGGIVKAGKEIRAAIIGSEAGTLTALTVGYDHELMLKYNSVIQEIQRITDDGERVKEALYALFRLQLDGKLPPEKEGPLKKLEAFQKELPDNLAALETQKAEIVDQLKANQDAVIIAEAVLHSGVKASFGIVYREIMEDQERCKLTLEGTKVLISEYRGD